MKTKHLFRVLAAFLLAFCLCLFCACNHNESKNPSDETPPAEQDKDKNDPPAGGNQENQGSQDEQESQGNQGEQGSQGNQGNQGESGNQGNQGGQGEQESQGNQGESGNQGSQGGQGEQGNQGNQGNQGEQEPLPIPEWKGEWVSAIFGGGPFVEGREEVLEDVTASGFNTIMIWSVHIHGDGTLYLNDTKAVDHGKLVIGQESVEFWGKLKGENSSIERIELSVGAGGCTDFEEIKKYIEKDGAGKETVLYQNMQTLIEATGADAVNFDDESCYDLKSATAFGQMCAEMGMKITFCPYVNISFWSNLAKALGEDADRVYLQCYSGGQLNDNQYAKMWRDWALSTGLRIIPGYWCGSAPGRCSAATVKSKLSRAADYTTGGFMWLYDDMMKMKSPNSTKDYATAINEANPHKGEEAQNVSARVDVALPEKKRG